MSRRTVRDWSVYLRASGPVGFVSTEHAEKLVDELYDWGGAIGSSGDGSWISAQFTVEAANLDKAYTFATEIFEKALVGVGLHDYNLDQAQLMTHEELERELSRPAYPQLLGIHEIAELLGVTRQRASALAASSHFPRPLAKLAAGPVWPRPWITRFVREWDRSSARKRTSRPRP